MIIKSKPTPSTADAVRNLTRHLLDKHEDNDAITTIAGSRENAMDALADAMRFNRKNCMVQFIITTKEDISSEQTRQAVNALVDEFGFGQKDIMLAVRHQKARHDGAACDRHWHVLVRNVDPETGRVMNMSHSYARQEKVARQFEVKNGLALTKGRHNRAVMQAVGNEVREKMKAAGLADGHPPASAYSGTAKAITDRKGIDLAAVRHEMRLLWQDSEGSWAKLTSAVQARGWRIVDGDKPGIMVLKNENDQFLGSVGRLIGLRKQQVINARAGAIILQPDMKKESRRIPESKSPEPLHRRHPAHRITASKPTTSQPASFMDYGHGRTRLAKATAVFRHKDMTQAEVDAANVREEMDERQRQTVEDNIRGMKEIMDALLAPPPHKVSPKPRKGPVMAPEMG